MNSIVAWPVPAPNVVSSEPAGVFDAAAVEAMEGARFEEFEATESRLAVQRIVFKPE